MQVRYLDHVQLAMPDERDAVSGTGLAWPTDVLQRIISGRNTTHQLGALLP